MEKNTDNDKYIHPAHGIDVHNEIANQNADWAKGRIKKMKKIYWIKYSIQMNLSDKNWTVTDRGEVTTNCEKINKVVRWRRV